MQSAKCKGVVSPDRVRSGEALWRCCFYCGLLMRGVVWYLLGAEAFLVGVC